MNPFFSISIFHAIGHTYTKIPLLSIWNSTLTGPPPVFIWPPYPHHCPCGTSWDMGPRIKSVLRMHVRTGGILSHFACFGVCLIVWQGWGVSGGNADICPGLKALRLGRLCGARAVVPPLWVSSCAPARDHVSCCPKSEQKRFTARFVSLLKVWLDCFSPWVHPAVRTATSEGTWQCVGGDGSLRKSPLCGAPLPPPSPPEATPCESPSPAPSLLPWSQFHLLALPQAVCLWAAGGRMESSRPDSDSSEPPAATPHSLVLIFLSPRLPSLLSTPGWRWWGDWEQYHPTSVIHPGHSCPAFSFPLAPWVFELTLKMTLPLSSRHPFTHKNLCSRLVPRRWRRDESLSILFPDPEGVLQRGVKATSWESLCPSTLSYLGIQSAAVLEDSLCVPDGLVKIWHYQFALRFPFSVVS